MIARESRGFTLVDLLVLIVIIGILIALLPGPARINTQDRQTRYACAIHCILLSYISSSRCMVCRAWL